MQNTVMENQQCKALTISLPI